MPDDSPPKVTVVITAYNHASYITQALESVMAQQAPFAWDIVIGDDASTDGTREHVQAFARRHPDRVQLVLPERNLGGGGNPLWFLCLEAARGEYIACLDGDDYWTAPDKLRTQVECLEAHPDSLLCFHNADVRFEGLARAAVPVYDGGRASMWSTDDVLREGAAPMSAIVMRGPGTALGWLRALDARWLQDWSIAALAAELAPIAYVDRVMSVYRCHAGGDWSGLSRGDQVAATIAVYDGFNAATRYAHDAVIQDEVARRSYEAFSEYESAGKPALASMHLARCLVRKPASLETYAPGIGACGPEIWSILEGRLKLCAHPWRFHVSRWLTRATAWARWTVADHRRLATLRRALKTGAPCGLLVARSSAVVERSLAPGLGNLTLEWITVGATEVEVRVDSATGPLLARGGPTGAATTGTWVHDGMVFVLRDASAVDPVATLDVLRVRVRAASRDAESPRAPRTERLARALIEQARVAAQAALSQQYADR